jgi:hypothetical protein
MQVLTNAGEQTRWTLSVGDPTFFGWAVVLGYIAAASLCTLAGNRENGSWAPHVATAAERLRPEFWFVLAIALGLMGLNKQLDLQGWLAQAARDVATYGGWYESRRPVQVAFVLLVTACGMAAVWLTYWYLRGSFDRYRLAYFGIVYLVTFVVIRAASFHHVDVLLTTGRFGLHINHVLELGGIGMTGYGAWHAARRNVRPKLRRGPERLRQSAVPRACE